MKSKLDLAHDWAMKALDEWYVTNTDDLVDAAWIYADAMYAENEKREKIESEEKRKQMRELLNSDNTFIEKEGQHFDDVEWQPDWSVAPDSKVQYFAVDESGIGGWYVNKPTLCFDHWYWSGFRERLDEYDNAPSFNYSGHWCDSLRKRPK